jgi:hypothetical protein
MMADIGFPPVARRPGRVDPGIAAHHLSAVTLRNTQFAVPGSRRR